MASRNWSHKPINKGKFTPWIDPDKVAQRGNGDKITFIYLNKSGYLSADWDLTHAELARSDENLKDQPADPRSNQWDALLGRIGAIDLSAEGMGKQIVAGFWENGYLGTGKYREILTVTKKIQSLVRVMKNRYPSYGVSLSTPYEGTFPIERMELYKGPGDIKLLTQEQFQLLNDLQKATGEDRKKIQAQLGMGGEVVDKNPWKTAMRNVGYTYPAFGDSIEKAASNLLEYVHDDWVQPDMFYKVDGFYTFIYLVDKDKLILRPANKSHYEIAYLNRQLGDAADPDLLVWDRGDQWKQDREALVGRLGVRTVMWKGKEIQAVILALWNDEKDINHPVYSGVRPLMHKLKGKISELNTKYGKGNTLPIFFSTSKFGLVPLEKEVEEVPDNHPWRTAVRKAGYTYPQFGDSLERTADNLIEGRGFASEWVDPDRFYQVPDFYTFIYLVDKDKLFTAPATDAHWEMHRYTMDDDLDDLDQKRKYDQYKEALVGRLGVRSVEWKGEQIKAIVFALWNQNDSKNHPVYRGLPILMSKMRDEIRELNSKFSDDGSALPIFYSTDEVGLVPLTNEEEEVPDKHPWKTAMKKAGYTYPAFGDSIEQMASNLLEDK